jgi:hypothetical protein
MIPRLKYRKCWFAWMQSAARSFGAFNRLRGVVNVLTAKDNGRVATGYYIVPIEPNWAVYRFEYQE